MTITRRELDARLQDLENKILHLSAALPAMLADVQDLRAGLLDAREAAIARGCICDHPGSPPSAPDCPVHGAPTSAPAEEPEQPQLGGDPT